MSLCHEPALSVLVLFYSYFLTKNLTITINYPRAFLCKSENMFEEFFHLEFIGGIVEKYTRKTSLQPRAALSSKYTLSNPVRLQIAWNCCQTSF